MKVENPTSRDIAEIAGVSQATVSRALRNSPLVREETRKRVQQVARELNYFVNRNAAGLRTHQSNTIALLLFDETEGEDAQINPFFLSMLGYITRAAAGLGYDVLISMSSPGIRSVATMSTAAARPLNTCSVKAAGASPSWAARRGARRNWPPVMTVTARRCSMPVSSPTTCSRSTP